MKKLKPFPAFLLLLMGVLASVVAVVMLVRGQALDGVTLLGTGQFLLALRLLWRRDSGIQISDIRFLFIVFYFLYSCTAGWIAIATNFGEYPGLVNATLLGALGLAGFNIALLAGRTNRHRPVVSHPSVHAKPIKPGLLPVIALTVGLILVISYAKLQGIDLSVSEGIDRGRFAEATIDQTWVVLMFLMTGAANYSVLAWPRLRFSSRCVVVLLLCTYVGFQLLLGDRRDFLPLLLAVTYVCGQKYRWRANLRTVAVAIAAAIPLLYVGTVRQQISGPLTDSLIRQNEFTAPFVITAYYAANPKPLLMGESYLRLPEYLMPRSIWPGKPTSLSIQFLIDGDMGFGQGYAFNSVAEAFINFGWVGPTLIMACFAFFLTWLRDQSIRYPVLCLTCYTLVVDFHRGEFALMLYEGLFVYAATRGLLSLERLSNRITWRFFSRACIVPSKSALEL
jgi:hypothetical protein